LQIPGIVQASPLGRSGTEPSVECPAEAAWSCVPPWPL
jgi:hypothetical protein